MEVSNFVVKKTGGKLSWLDKKYNALLNDVLFSSDEEKQTRWDLYNLLIKELFEIDGNPSFQEIKYRLTGNENPNDVLLDILSRYPSNSLNYMVNYLSKKISEYAEEDFYKKFFF